MAHCACPNDGMDIPLVSEVRVGAEPVRFFWCWSCEELYASVGNPGTDAAGFADDGRGGWRVSRVIGPKREVRVAVAAISHVGPFARTTGPPEGL